ncbi:MAG: FeoC-like transcriptional regulator [Candidatus Thorarchaeota archaeon]
MIKKVMQLIVEERLLSKKEIAHRVGIQVETLDDMIRLLIQRGFLRTEVEGCEPDSACAGCHSAAGCDLVPSGGQTFFVTEKGKTYASMGGGSEQ